MINEFAPYPTHDAIMNYPNPFSSQTTIEFFLNNDSPISIFVTDITGKKVATIINSESYVKGSHTITYNGSNLAAGNYICVLETTNERKAIRIVKTK